jgi:general nucleoside transport system permease protein
MSVLENAVLISFLTAAVRLTTPVAFAGLGEVLAERAGVLNIGLEGIMLSAAFTAVVGSHYFGGPWVGLMFAVGTGLLIGGAVAYLTIALSSSQVVVGVAINILAFGLTTFLARIYLRGVEAVPAFQPLPIPVLASVPLLGPVLFAQTPFIYALMFLVPALTVFLFRTPWGLALRAAGEHPRAVETAGIDVIALRYIAVVACSILTALGGCFLSLAQLNLFTENMSAGRGFIALAAVVFGKWHPVGVLGAALLFGLADALQLIIQTYSIGIPYQLFVMLPYVLSLLALSGVVGRAVPPAAAGLPYRADEP